MARRRRPYGWPPLSEQWQRRPPNTYEQVFPVLRQVFLEDSWVLQLWDAPNGMVFLLDAVVTPEFPDYRGARPGEQYDYRRARLSLAGSSVLYEPSGDPPSQDATGTDDHGNIDSWTVGADGWSTLRGGWGTARILDVDPELHCLDERSTRDEDPGG